MSVYPVNKESLATFHGQLPPLPNEPQHQYAARVEEAGLARVLDRAAARDVRTYREAVTDCDRRRVPLLINDPLPPPVDPSNVIRLSRAEAKDPARYRQARDRAEKMGAQLVLLDG